MGNRQTPRESDGFMVIDRPIGAMEAVGASFVRALLSCIREMQTTFSPGAPQAAATTAPFVKDSFLQQCDPDRLRCANGAHPV